MIITDRIKKTIVSEEKLRKWILKSLDIHLKEQMSNTKFKGFPKIPYVWFYNTSSYLSIYLSI